MTGRPLYVLAVDDSAVMREIIHMVFASDSEISLDTAADPFIAMHKMERRRPDVILLDLELPGMDGLTFLRKIMKEDPIPVVVCTTQAEKALEALSEGAVEVLNKPRTGVREFVAESAVIFIDAVRSAAQARSPRVKTLNVSPRLSADAILPPVTRPPRNISDIDSIVAIGASTGGTDALADILGGLPEDAPGIVVVQHMPEHFTKAFAKRLNNSSKIAVKEAENGDKVRIGQALIAPGNRHVLVVLHRGEPIVEVVDGPLVSRHRPSVDVLFRSVALAVGGAAVGVLLTGMGDDGARGMLEMRKVGAFTIAQDEESCVVFGMPKAAIALGGVQQVLPLNKIPRGILQAAVSVSSKGSKSGS